MIAWHCTDGWLAEAYRQGPGWSAARVAGGLAAPFFLFAVGMGVALGAQRGRSVGRAMTRGLELLVLGHGLQLATWAIDHYAIAHLEAWPALVLGAGFVTVALFALRRSARALASPTALLAGAHLTAVFALEPALASNLLRFDILHCIGGSVVACASLTAAVKRWQQPAWGPSAAVMMVGAGLVGASPLLAAALANTSGGLAWLAREPALRHIAPFPLLPWCGYAILGSAFALAPLDRARRRPGQRLLVFVAALGLATLTFEGGLPFTRRLLTELPSLRPLARLAFAAGVTLALGAGLAAFAHRRGAAVLAALGRVSLPVYALHLQVAYGTLARPLRHTLTPAVCALLVALLVAASFFGARWIERRGVDAKRGRAFARTLGSTANSRA